MASTNLIYDRCAYNQKLSESMNPLGYRLYEGNYVNCKRCNTKQLYSGQYENCTNCYGNGKPTLLRVDVESDLRGIDKTSSLCDVNKYNPNCTNQKTCIKKNDSRVPFSSPPFLCEIRPTNPSSATGKGLHVPSKLKCDMNKN